MGDQGEQDRIRKNVALILHQCRKDAHLYRYKVSMPFGTTMQLDYTTDPQVAEDLRVIKLHNEQVLLLNALFQSQNHEGRAVVIDEVFKGLFVYSSSAQVFVFLARYYSFQKAITVLANNLRYSYAQVPIGALAQLLHSDHAYMTDDDLDFLGTELASALKREWDELPQGKIVETFIPPSLRAGSSRNPRSVKRMVTHLSEAEAARRQHYDRINPIVVYVLKQGQRIQYLRLRNELTESANFEINQDRDRLLGSLTSLGFSNKLTDFLKFSEVEFVKADGTFQYKTYIDQIRSFYAELLTETADKVAASRGETLAKAGIDSKRPVEIRKYLKATDFFSDEFESLVNGLYKFMSDEGTHTLGATKDVARIARNIAIEIGLLVTKRVRQELKPATT